MASKVRHAKGSRAIRRPAWDEGIAGGAESAFMERILAIDLVPVREELIRKKVFRPRRAEEAVREYRRFLFLQGIFLRPDGDGCAVFVPPDEVSEVWHAHILMTRKYAADCETLFGRFLHHGYAPAPGTDAYLGGVRRFLEAYADRFGEPPARFTFTCAPLRYDEPGGGT